MLYFLLNIYSYLADDDDIPDYFVGVPVQIFMSLEPYQHLALNRGSQEYTAVNKFLPADKYKFDDRVYINRNGRSFELEIGGSSICASGNKIGKCKGAHRNSIFNIVPKDLSYEIRNGDKCVTVNDDSKLNLQPCGEPDRQLFDFKRVSISKQCNDLFKNKNSTDGETKDLSEIVDSNPEYILVPLDKSNKQKGQKLCFENHDFNVDALPEQNIVDLNNSQGYSSGKSPIRRKRSIIDEHEENSPNFPAMRSKNGTSDILPGMMSKFMKLGKDNMDPIDITASESIENLEDIPIQTILDIKNIGESETGRNESELDTWDKKLDPQTKKEMLDSLEPKYQNKYGAVGLFDYNMTKKPEVIRSSTDPDKTIDSRSFDDLLRSRAEINGYYKKKRQIN